MKVKLSERASAITSASASAQVKFHQILVIFETKHQFFFKFYINLQGHEIKLLCTSWLKFYIF